MPSLLSERMAKVPEPAHSERNFKNLVPEGNMRITVSVHGDFHISFHFVHPRVIIAVYLNNSKVREGRHHG